MTMPIGSVASALCPDPYGTASYLNPACWSVWGDESKTDNPAQQQVLADLCKSDPQGCSDYMGVTGANPVGYLTGVTDVTGAMSSGLSTLLLLAGAALLIGVVK